MALTVAELRFLLDADTRGLDRGLARADAGMGRSESRFAKLGRAAAAGLAVAGFAVAGFAKAAISGASDLAETVNKSEVIFGRHHAAMMEWSKGAATSFGLSRQQALAAAAGFGDMFDQLGFGGQRAATMSRSVVQLAADLGSFHNLDTAEVLDMIGAGFRGEYDALQRVIPAINAARVESEALAMTGKTSADALTAQEKAAATLAIVQKDGARAAGDFARTSDGLANSSKILRAQWSDMTTQLGTGLVPIMAAFVGFLSSEGIPALVETGRTVKAIVGFIGEHSTAALALVSVLGALVVVTKAHAAVLAVQAAGGVLAWLAATGPALAATKAWTAAVWLWNAALLANPLVLIAALVVGLVAAFVIAYRSSDEFRDKVNAALRAVRDVAQAIAGFFVEWGGRIVGALASAWSSIRSGASEAWNAVRNTTAAVWAAIIGVVAERVAGVMSAAGKLVDIVGDVRRFFGDAREAAAEKLTSLVTLVGGVPGRVVAALGDLSKTLYSAGIQLIAGFAAGITDKIGDAVDAVKDGLGKIKGMLPGSPIQWGPLKPWNTGAPGKELMRLLADGITAGGRDLSVAGMGAVGRLNVSAPVLSVPAGGDWPGRPPSPPGAGWPVAGSTEQHFHIEAVSDRPHDLARAAGLAVRLAV